jgi:hypothetical protein
MDIKTFRSSFAGQILEPQEAGYDAARQIWNAIHRSDLHRIHTRRLKGACCRLPQDSDRPEWRRNGKPLKQLLHSHIIDSRCFHAVQFTDHRSGG